MRAEFEMWNEYSDNLKERTGSLRISRDDESIILNEDDTLRLIDFLTKRR